MKFHRNKRTECRKRIVRLRLLEGRSRSCFEDRQVYGIWLIEQYMPRSWRSNVWNRSMFSRWNTSFSLTLPSLHVGYGRKVSWIRWQNEPYYKYFYEHKCPTFWECMRIDMQSMYVHNEQTSISSLAWLFMAVEF